MAFAQNSNFIVVGSGKAIVIQVLLALRTCIDARCIVVCARGVRFLRWSNLASDYLEADFGGEDDDSFVERVNRFAEAVPGTVVVPADCDGARMTSRVRNRLKAASIPAPDCTMLDLFDDKWRFYQFCHQYGLNVPPSCLFRSKYDLEFAPTSLQLGIPFVVKPVNQEASRGVHVLGSKADYEREILNNDAYQFAPLIAQRHIRGIDVGLDLLSLRGRVAALAVQQRDYPQHDAAAIKFVSNRYLENAAHRICGESGYHGVMNVDARIEDGSGKVYLFESNPRFWRSLSASAWCGLNFVAESVMPSAPTGEIRTLSSGSADTFYHPLFRPSLWRDAMFDHHGHRGRMVRLMMRDMCTLASQAKLIVQTSVARTQSPAVSAPYHASP